MTRQQLNIRLNDVTTAQLDDLKALGYSATSAVVVAIDRLWHQECQKGESTMDWQTESGFYEGDDRIKQVNALQFMATDIAQGSDDPNIPAVERVAYYTKHATLPIWFDPHDYDLLIEFVQASENTDE